MNSGKSDTLIKTAYNYEERELNVVVVKPKVDTKSGGIITARAGHSRNVDILADATTNLLDEISAKRNIACVLVDEAQFLSSEHVSQLYALAKQHNISVICYGLRSDFQSKLFPGSKRLLEISDNIEKLPTMCFCGKQAEFNTRRVNNRYIFDGDQVAIDDGQDVSYDSLCGVHYIEVGGRI